MSCTWYQPALDLTVVSHNMLVSLMRALTVELHKYHPQSLKHPHSVGTLRMLFLSLVVLSIGFLGVKSSPALNPWVPLLAKYPAYASGSSSYRWVWIPVEEFQQNFGNSKRNGGMAEDCRGKYDPSIYTQLDNICEDCYNLYKEPDVHQMCR